MVFSVIIILSLISQVSAVDYKRRCLLYKGKCVKFCPRAMHPYHTRCDTNTMSQRTCVTPDSYILGFTCGWSRCDCNGDLVLNEATGHCTAYSDCPKISARRQRRKKVSAQRQHKRIRIQKEDREFPIMDEK
ncbi:uncharacterized protein LOC142978273 [Anticarsia gemmatalis]|uniref:uncharacterized protein LOC142978273 n=1 Tax=Anticarsia gemmatalis TaxID=129554 RepID=UPI003F76EF10